MERRPANEMQTLAALPPRDGDLWEMYMTWQRLRRNLPLSLSPLLSALSLHLPPPSLDPIAAVPVLAHLLHLPRKALDQG